MFCDNTSAVILIFAVLKVPLCHCCTWL